MVEDALVGMLENAPGVAALAADRIYPIEMPPNTELPAIVYQRISGPRVHSHSGPSHLAHPLFQLSCWGADQTVAKTLADQARCSLDGFKGVSRGEDIHGMLVTDVRDSGKPEEGSYRVIVEVRIWHRET